MLTANTTPCNVLPISRNTNEEEQDMFEILDNEGNVIETATSLPQAQDVAGFLTRTTRTLHNCRLAA